jgi:transmembrane sensor
VEDKNLIYNLIVLENSLGMNDLEKNVLQSWIEQSDENKAEYLAVLKVLGYSERLAAMKKIDVKNDLSRVKRRIFQEKRSKSRMLLVNFQRIAAVLIVPLLIFTLWSVGHLLGRSEKDVALKSSETSYGVRSRIQLSDGTIVILNSASKLIYPEEFNGKSREVKLTGEAYFQVKSDVQHPFLVDIGGYKVKATGTRFNISNYPEDREFNVFLEVGKVSLLAGSNEAVGNAIPLKEKEMIFLNRAKKQYRIHEGDGMKYLAWIDGVLKFKNDSADDVARRMGRWFNAEIIFDAELRKSGYIFTATFKHESLEEALMLLSVSSPIKFNIVQESQKDDFSFSKRKVIISKNSL